MKLKTLIDRKNTSHIKVLDKMVTELSPYMNDEEVDATISLINTLAEMTVDSNPSADDSKVMLQGVLGVERFEEIVKAWGQKNQKFLSVFGTLKYREKSTGRLYDGLDDDDSEDDYEKVYI